MRLSQAMPYEWNKCHVASLCCDHRVMSDYSLIFNRKTNFRLVGFRFCYWLHENGEYGAVKNTCSNLRNPWGKWHLELRIYIHICVKKHNGQWKIQNTISIGSVWFKIFQRRLIKDKRTRRWQKISTKRMNVDKKKI